MGLFEIIFDALCDMLNDLLTLLGSFSLDPFPGLMDNVTSVIYSSAIARTIFYYFVPVAEMLAMFYAWVVLFPLCIGINVLWNWLRAKF